MKRKKRRVITKFLFKVAEIAGETTSCIGFYEPKFPKDLVDAHKERREK